jgi:hypothetical protein
MWVYDQQVHAAGTEVKLGGVFGGVRGTIVNYIEGTYPCLYMVKLATGQVEKVAHNVIKPA